jgi:hypothetical protein
VRHCAIWRVLGEVGEIAPGRDAVPFGAGLVLAQVAFPALAGGDAEDGVVLLVLCGLDFYILSETADKDTPRILPDENSPYHSELVIRGAERPFPADGAEVLALPRRAPAHFHRAGRYYRLSI